MANIKTNIVCYKYCHSCQIGLKIELTKHEDADEDCKEHKEDAKCWGESQSSMIRTC